MAENITPADANQDPTPQAKKKRRGLWWKIPLVLLVLLMLLIVFLPKIASTGAVRSLVLGKVNEQIDGRLEISDWSLSWTGGVSVSGVKLYDGRGRLVLEVGKVATPASLLSVARGNLDFGRTTIEDVNLTQVEVYPDGSSNYQRIFAKMISTKQNDEKDKSKGEQIKSAAQPKIDLIIKPFRGTITALDASGKPVAPALEIRPDSEIAAKLGEASEPISERVKMVLAVGGKAAGSVSIEGTAQVPADGKSIKANQKINISSLDLGAVSPLLALGAVKAQMSGMLSGDLVADIASMDQGVIKGEFKGSDLEFSGEALKGDVIRSHTLQIPVDLTLQPGQVINGAVSIVVDQGNVLVDMGSCSTPALQWYATAWSEDKSGKIRPASPPAGTGIARVSVNVPQLPAVLNMLKHNVKLQEGVAVTVGSFSVNVAAQLKEDGLRVDAPINLSGLEATRNGQKIGPLQPMTIQAGARLAPVEGKSQPEPRDLSFDLASAFASVKGGGATLSQLQIAGDADVARLKEQFGQVFDLSMFRSGQVHFALSNVGDVSAGGPLRPEVTVSGKELALDLAGSAPGQSMAVENTSFSLHARPVMDQKSITLSAAEPLVMKADATLLAVDGKGRRTMWSNSPVTVTVSAVVAEMKNVTAQVAVTLPFATVSLDEVKIALPQATVASSGATTQPQADVLAMLQKAKWTVKVADLSQAYAAMQRFAPPAAAATGQAAAPLQLAGQLDLMGDVARAGNSSNFTLNTTASGVSVRHGEAAMKLEKPATVQLAGAVTTRMGKDIVEQIAGLAMAGQSQQLGELGGALRVSGDLAEIARFADAFAGTRPGAPSVLPVQGQLVSEQEIAYRSGTIALSGKTPLTNFKVMQEGKAVFSESQVLLNNNVSLDLAKRILKMEDVSLKLVQTDALAFSAKGQISDYGRQNSFENLVITLTPDLAKVWNMIRPLLPPEKQAQIGKLVVAGKHPIEVKLAGSYPMMTADGKPAAYAQAIKSVQAQGSFLADLIDYQQYGVKMENFSTPFMLKNGVLQLVTPDGKPAAPSTLNEGKLYVPAARVDLTGEHMLLSTPPNVKLMEAVKLNSVMASFAGEKVTPFLHDSKDASGLLDVTIVRCDRLPLDGSMMTNAPSNKGEADVLVSATNLNVSSKGAGMVLGLVGFQPAAGQDHIVGNMKDASIKLQGGRVHHNMRVQFVNRDLGLNGDLNLMDNVYRIFQVDVPSEMVANRVGGKNMVQFLPPRVGLTFSGPVNNLKLNEQFIKDLAKGAAQKQLESGLLGGGKSGAGAGEGQDSGGGLGGLLDSLKSKKK